MSAEEESLHLKLPMIGTAEYISKPVSTAVLRKMVCGQIRQRKVRDYLYELAEERKRQL
jgi:PleD family two-component response regulator